MTVEDRVHLRRQEEILDSNWNYIDVLLLALSYLPKGTTTLKADTREWNRIISAVKHGLQDQPPELLAEVHFELRPPLPPHSEQLDEFFKLAGISGKLTTSPDYKTFYISEATKTQIQARREQKLSQHIPQIRAISVHLQELVV
ncbi:MAG: hypothetical protein AAB599_01610 [Patescibacteria group bacterium]